MLDTSIIQSEQDMVFKGTTLYGGNPYAKDKDGKLKLISAVIKNSNKSNPYNCC